MGSLITIEEYDRDFQAHVAKLALEQAGIQCFLANETIVSMDWFMANAVGGIRLQVAESDAEEAFTILSEIRAKRQADEAALKDTWIVCVCGGCKKTVCFEGTKKGRLESCPECSRYMDVPEQTDPSLDETQVAQSIDSHCLGGASGQTRLLSNRLFLLAEMFFVLWFAFFSDLIRAIDTYSYCIEENVSMTHNLLESPLWLVGRSVMACAAMLPIFLVFGMPGKDAHRLPRNYTKDLVATLILTVLALTISGSLSLFGEPPLYVSTLEWPNASTVVTKLSLVISLVLSIVANSIAEELVMRAYLIDRLERFFGSTTAAVVLAAVLFGSYHIYMGLIPGLVNATALGFLFGIYYARTRRLVPLIGAHTLYNFAVIFMNGT